MDHPDMIKIPHPNPGHKDLSSDFDPGRLDRKLEKIWKKAQMSGFSSKSQQGLFHYNPLKPGYVITEDE